MADEPKPQSFWQTVPGILTGVAAVVTALTGLLVALNQLGVFGGKVAATGDASRQAVNAQTTPGRAEPPTQKSAQTQDEPSVKRFNLLSPDHGGKLVLFSEPGWKQTIVGPGGYAVVGAQQPVEAVYAFRDGGLAVFDEFRVLVSSVTPSNVKEFELLAATESATGPFTSIGKFNTRNVLAPDSPYQDFRFRETRARYLKVRLLTNHNGYGNPLEIREFQLLGHFAGAAKPAS